MSRVLLFYVRGSGRQMFHRVQPGDNRENPFVAANFFRLERGQLPFSDGTS